MGKIPRRGETALVSDGDGFSFQSISKKRWTAIWVCQSVRSNVIVTLWFSGSLWLCRTESAPDLLLNAAAMCVVIDMFFAVGIPQVDAMIEFRKALCPNGRPEHCD